MIMAGYEYRGEKPFSNVYFTGIVRDKIGRKKSILLYEVIHIAVMIGAAVSPSIEVLYVFRFLQGFGLGALGMLL